VSTSVSRYPTAAQKKTIWAAITGACIVFFVAVAGYLIWGLAHIANYLQPILIPVAIAAVLAYLLDPLVTRMTRRGLSRAWAVVLLFLTTTIAIVTLGSWVIPMISVQSSNFARELPAYTVNARDRVVDLVYRYDKMFGLLGGGRGKSASSTIANWFVGATPSPRPRPNPSGSPSGNGLPSPAASEPPTETISAASTKPQPSLAERQRLQNYVEQNIRDFEKQLPTWSGKIWTVLKTSIGGIFGVTGFLFSMVLVPIYLFFFLKERPRIEARWKEYLPVREGPLKDELAEVISQINHYVIAYFRGQLLVCLVDGCLIGSALTILGLNFAPLIGVVVVVLTMIPYIGIFVCWIPAVLIAAFQWGDWSHPIWVTIIFVVIQNLEGNFYAPRIVGESVGLHPLTVIVSIFVWGLLIGGVLGPLLAVPLTATVKVLLARYVWGRRLRDAVMEPTEHAPIVQET
jgi:predicted PurR-regulated permease PerM